MILCAMLLCIAYSINCTRLFRGKMHSDWFNGVKILQDRWQHGENVGYCYPSGLEKTLCKWDIYVPLVTKGVKKSWDTIVHIIFSFQHVAQLKLPCMRRFYRRRETILNIVMHFNSRVSYFNFHLIRTWPCYQHHAPHSLLLLPTFTSSFCYMFFSFTRFLLYITYY